MLWETIRLSLRSVTRNALRSFLTLLGIVIGVAAVIAMITIGNGTTAKVKADIGKLGSNLLMVHAGAGGRPGGPHSVDRPLEEKDVKALRRGLTGVVAISAASQQSVRVIYQTDSMPVSVTGADPEYMQTRDWHVASGRPFTGQDVKAGTSVCLIGKTVQTEFFGNGDPLGLRIRVGRLSCQIVGVLESKGFSGFGQDQDNIVIMPLTTFQRRISGSQDIETIYVSAADGVDTSVVQSDIEAIMRESRRITAGKEDDFRVRDMTQIADTMASTTAVMTGMLGALAGVSLLVGGIGIMNIMLVSVTERTREIGIRLAIGAHEKHILLQFLVEATVLSILGGLIGIALGLALAGAATYTLSIPFNPSITIILIAVGFSGLIGMGFGFFPALRGARLDPIDALRHE